MGIITKQTELEINNGQSRNSCNIRHMTQNEGKQNKNTASKTEAIRNMDPNKHKNKQQTTKTIKKDLTNKNPCSAVPRYSQRISSSCFL